MQLLDKINTVYRSLNSHIRRCPQFRDTSRIGNFTRLIHTLLYVMTIHTYIHKYLYRHKSEGENVSIKQYSSSSTNVLFLNILNLYE